MSKLVYFNTFDINVAQDATRHTQTPLYFTESRVSVFRSRARRPPLIAFTAKLRYNHRSCLLSKLHPHEKRFHFPSHLKHEPRVEITAIMQSNIAIVVICLVVFAVWVVLFLWGLKVLNEWVCIHFLPTIHHLQIETNPPCYARPKRCTIKSGLTTVSCAYLMTGRADAKAALREDRARTTVTVATV
jgi:hypothetical protein